MVCGFKPLSYALLFFVFLGLISIISAALFLLLSPARSRTNSLIVKYNEQVERWNTFQRLLFQRWEFSLQHDGTNKTFALAKEISSDPNFQDDFQELLKYDPLRYVYVPGKSAQDPLFSSPITLNTEAEVAISFLYDEVPSSTFADTASVSMARLQPSLRLIDRNHERSGSPTPSPIPLHTRTSDEDEEERDEEEEEKPRPVIQAKLFILRSIDRDPDCSIGYQHGGKCYLLYRLKSICTKVVQVSDDSLRFDTTYGGIGCRPTNPSLKESLDVWSPAVYALHLPSDNDTALENVTVSFSDVEIFVRSNEDPYIMAQHITNGTLNFSELQDSSAWIIVRAYIGFGSMGLGVLITLSAVLSCCVCFSIPKLRPLLVDSMREEHEALLQLTRAERAERTQSRSLRNRKIHEFMFPSSSIFNSYLADEEDDDDVDDDDSDEAMLRLRQ